MLSQNRPQTSPRSNARPRLAAGTLLIVLAAGLQGAQAQSPAIPTPYTAPDAATAAVQSLPAGIRAIDRLRREARPEEALKAADAWIASHPQDTAGPFMRGLALADLGRIDEAIATLEALANAHPELDQPLNNLGVLHARSGAFDRAREALEQAVRANPKSTIALANLADLHLRMALDAYEQLSRLEPGNRAAAGTLLKLRELSAPATRPPGQNTAPPAPETP
jgi:tetratricopeptide (TPR) repeat protein